MKPLPPSDSQFSDIQATLKKFYRQEVLPLRDEMDQNPEVCRQLMKRLGGLGYLTPDFPEEYGGLGGTRELRAMMGTEACRISPSLSLSIGAHGLLCGGTIAAFGSKEQKERYLPKLASGEFIGAWGVTEPGAGSDVGGMATLATLKGEHYLLKGNKTFITNAPICDVVVVFAKTGQDANTITGFILEKGQEGLAFGKAIGKFGMEGSPTGDLYLDNVKVARSHVLGEPGSGFKQIKAIFNNERMYAGCAAIAVMEHCLETSLKYASQRKAFGEPIMAYQAIQLKIAQIYAKISMTEAAAKELYGMSEDDPRFHMKASALKIFASQWAVESCSETMQVLGGLGYTKESDIGRFLRDSKLYEIGGGTSDIQHLIIFKGLAKSLRPA